MHVCDEFRERITEQMLDRANVDNDVDTQRELLVCSSCADFYTESREMLDALSAVNFEIPENQWNSMADRLRVRIHEDYAARTHSFRRRWLYAPAFAAAVVLKSVGFWLWAWQPPQSLRISPGRSWCQVCAMFSTMPCLSSV